MFEAHPGALAVDPDRAGEHDPSLEPDPIHRPQQRCGADVIVGDDAAQLGEDMLGVAAQAEVADRIDTVERGDAGLRIVEVDRPDVAAGTEGVRRPAAPVRCDDLVTLPAQLADQLCADRVCAADHQHPAAGWSVPAVTPLRLTHDASPTRPRL